MVVPIRTTQLESMNSLCEREIVVLRARCQKSVISMRLGGEFWKRATLLVMRSFRLSTEVEHRTRSLISVALPKDIDKLTRDVKGVEKTVILVEQNPARYSHIDAVCFVVSSDL